MEVAPEEESSVGGLRPTVLENMSCLLLATSSAEEYKPGKERFQRNSYHPIATREVGGEVKRIWGGREGGRENA
jgi:hypothetical protein